MKVNFRLRKLLALTLGASLIFSANMTMSAEEEGEAIVISTESYSDSQSENTKEEDTEENDSDEADHSGTGLFASASADSAQVEKLKP